MGGGVSSEKRVMEKGEKTGSSEKRGTVWCKNRKRGGHRRLHVQVNREKVK